MSDTKKDAKLSLKAMINKKKNKVFFAEADNHFVDILLSFLTLPLGRILKILEKHYGDDEIPTIGSLSSLYHSLADLDNAHFVTEAAKETLLNPTSLSEAEYKNLTLDFTDSPPAQYSSGVVFTKPKSSFIISDDLHIFPYETSLVEIISSLGITDMDKAEAVQVDLGLTEIVKLLKASLTSPTPLSDVILNKTTHSTIMESKQQIPMQQKQNTNCKNLSLKVMVQKSTGEFLYAQAKDEFAEFLFSFLNVPLGGVEHLLAGKTCFKAINNLYWSITSDAIDDKYFKIPYTKSRLMKPDVTLTHDYNLWGLCRYNFRNGLRCVYLQVPQTYKVGNDLTVTPFCFVTMLSSLSERKINLSDVEEMELEIGLEEALSILKASLSSTSALSDALLSDIPKKKRPKREEV